MQAEKATLNELIQQHFQQQESQLAIQLIVSLDDISLRNLHFVDFMEEFAMASNGYSQNTVRLASLTEAQLYVIEQFFLYVQKQGPTCYRRHIETGLQTIRHLRQQTKLVS